MIVRPTIASIDRGAIFALLSAIALAARDLATRSLDTAIPSIAVALSSSVAISAFGVAYAVFDVPWVELHPPVILAFLGPIVLLVANSILGVIAFRLADVSMVSPIRYVSLPIAMALSFTMFGDTPDFFGLAGGFLIVGCGVALALQGHKGLPSKELSVN